MHWHFPRKKLAEQYIGLLGIGMMSSYAICAPRRKGKTCFLLKDLAPIASQQGYVPVYVCLSQNINAPHESLILALEEALAALNKPGGMSRLLNTQIRKAAVRNELLGKMKAEFADTPNQAQDKDLFYLDSLLSDIELAVGKKKVLLLVDEVQHLATATQFLPLARTLRTMLGRVKSVLSGSSRRYMSLLLDDEKSPFYHFSEMGPFPDLGFDFLAFLNEQLRNGHRLDIPIPLLEAAFDELDRSPNWMIRFVLRLCGFREEPEDALSFTLQLIEEAEGYADIAQNLRDQDRLVFMCLMNGGNPFSSELLDRIAKETKVKGIPGTVQRSLERMMDLRVVSQLKRGHYQVEHPGLFRHLTASQRNTNG